MSSSQVALENASAQWELYDEATEKLSKWIKETDQAVKIEAGLQSSLPEKRAQLDRVRVWITIF